MSLVKNKNLMVLHTAYSHICFHYFLSRNFGRMHTTNKNPPNFFQKLPNFIHFYENSII